MNQEPVYNIQLTAPQLQVIATALQEAPFRHAAPIIASLQRQVDEIEKQRAEAAPEADAQDAA